MRARIIIGIVMALVCAWLVGMTSRQADAVRFNVGTGRALLGGNGHGSGPPSNPAGKILLVDGVSFILQTDSTSKICRAGGC